MDPLGSHALTAFGTLAASIAYSVWQGRPRLVHGIPHLFSFQFQGGQHLTTQTVTLQNVGRRSARNVEITFTAPPEISAVFPQIKHEAQTLPDGSHVLSIEYLAPRQAVTLELLATEKAMPTLVSVRSDHGLSHEHAINLAASVTEAWQVLLSVLIIAAPAFAVGWWLGRP